MRMLTSDIPTTVVDASSTGTAPLLVTPPASSTSASAAASRSLLPPPPAGGSNKGSFDADMVMVLAALLSVLTIALGLNSLIRCALHYYGRRAHNAVTVAGAAPPAAAATAPAVTTTAADAGLKKRALSRIPVAVYEAKAGAAAAECAICLGEFAGGEKVRLLPRCNHGFHVRCIDMWFEAHSSCPICRDSSLDDGVGAGDETVAGAGTTTTTT